VATWRYGRGDGIGSENQMLGANFLEAAPRKFTRLHLPGSTGMRALYADTDCKKLTYRFTNLMVQKRGTNLESAFAAIIEPFVGEPFIESVKLASVDGNENDALRAVAASVRTKNGLDDLCFADGRPDKIRSLPAGTRIAGDFAYISRDADGVRQATLSGGTLIETPGLTLRVAQRERTGRVTAVDYAKKQIQIDQPWPSTGEGGVFEIGSPERSTSYTLSAVEPGLGNSALLTVTGGAEYFRGEISEVDKDGSVTVNPQRFFGHGTGMDKNWTVSNEARTKFWRASVVRSEKFQLEGEVNREDFEPGGKLLLWEYGVGDTVRQRTFASLRRTGPKTYEVTGNTDVEIIVGDTTRKFTALDFAKAPLQMTVK
jgi:hypothetical protein